MRSGRRARHQWQHHRCAAHGHRTTPHSTDLGPLLSVPERTPPTRQIGRTTVVVPTRGAGGRPSHVLPPHPPLLPLPPPLLVGCARFVALLLRLFAALGAAPARPRPAGRWLRGGGRRRLLALSVALLPPPRAVRLCSPLGAHFESFCGAARHPGAGATSGAAVARGGSAEVFGAPHCSTPSHHVW